MVMKISIIALILFGLLAAVSNREVAEASEVWPGPGGMTATDGMHPGDAVLTWSMVQEEPHYRIGWIVASEYQENGFAGAHWETGFVFADVPNRGQASHLMSDLTAGEKYHFVVWGHHGNPDTPESSPPLATLQLADLPPAPSDQPSALSGQTGECGSRDGVRTDFQENWCIACYHDESGDGEYCLVVPLGFLDPEETDDWVRGIGEGAFAGLSGNLADIDDRKKYYRDILLEMAIQPAKRGDVFITLPEEVREATDVAELVAGSVDVYAEIVNEDLFKAHLEHLHAAEFFLGIKLGTHLVDVAVAAAANRAVEIETARKRLGVLEPDIRMAIPTDRAWGDAFTMVWNDLDDMVSEDGMTRWSNALEDNIEEIAATISLYLVKTAVVAGAKAAATAAGVGISIPTAPIAITVGIAVDVTYDIIKETDQFWDELIMASTALQVYLVMTSIGEDEDESDVPCSAEDEDDILCYATLTFYQHLLNAMDAEVRVFRFNQRQLISHRLSVAEQRNLTLKRMIETTWMPDEDINQLRIQDRLADPDLASGERSLRPRGIWSDGMTLWVTFSDSTFEPSENPFRAYSFANGAYIDGFDMPSPSSRIIGMWSDQTTMWIVFDPTPGGYIQAFALKENRHGTTRLPNPEFAVPESDFNTLEDAGNSAPRGIWSNNEIMWVSDSSDSKIYAYGMDDKQWEPGSDLDGLRAAGNDNPQGIWSDETTMWVADKDDARIYAYEIATGRRELAREIELVNVPGVVTNTDPADIWSHDETMWVLDEEDGKLYAYQLPPPTEEDPEPIPFQQNPSLELGRLNLAENHHATGIWSDGTTAWVADHDDNKIYSYTMSDGSWVRDDALDLDDEGINFPGLPASGNNHATGIWSHGGTMWVADYEDDQIYAYRLSDGERVQGEEIPLAQSDVHAQDATGIWSDAGEETMWVADRSDKKIYGYDLSNPNYVRLAGTIGVLDCAGNDHPWGIWSDGATMWVGDDGKDRIYAYSMRDNLRDPSKEFDTLAGANNRDPRGIWSDGDAMWVADDDNDWVYAYNMPDKPLLTPVPAIPGTPSRPIVAPLGYPSVVIPAVVIVKWTASANANFHLVYLTSTDGTEHRYLDRVFCGNDQNILVVPYDPIQLFDRFNVADRITAHYPFSQTLLNPLKDYQFRVIAGRLEPDGTVQWSEWSRCSQVIRPDGASEVQPPLWDQPTDLCMLSVGPAKLEPAFKTGERNYSATTDQRRVTITPASDQSASFTYSVNNVLTRDGDPTLPGFQADLECGANTVEIKVASADGEVSDTYTIDVTRETGIPPEAPVFSQVFGGPESLQLRFPLADSNCAGLITWYYFRYSEDGVNWQVIEKRFYSTQFSISDLTPGTAYRVQAQARTKYGVSPWSATATGTPKIKPARNPADAVGVLGLSRAFVELLHDDLEIVYVVDTSGSMSGSKLDQLKIALASVRDKQGVDNTAVALVRFSTSSSVLLNFVETGAGNWNQDWTNAINGLAATGGTGMYAAMRTAVGILPAQDNCPTPTTCRGRDIVLMTDGQAGDSSLASTAINEAVNKGVQVHTVAFGTDAEETALQNIATQTDGTYVKVQPE